jgi:hypothetical protein
MANPPRSQPGNDTILRELADLRSTLVDRLDTAVERTDQLGNRVSRLERDSAKGERADAIILGEIAGLKQDLTDMRGLVTMETDRSIGSQGVEVAKAAASGAAQGATTAKASNNKAFQAIMVLSGLTAFATFIQNAKSILNFFLAIFGLGQPGAD